MTDDAARTVARKTAAGSMTWSAGMTIMVPWGSFLRTIQAARPTQGAVSRGQGSAMTFSGGSSGSWARVASAWSAPVTIKIRSPGTRGSIRATVCWSMVASPKSRRSCLGRSRRLLGQNRVPLPPAMMIACNMRRPGFGFPWPVGRVSCPIRPCRSRRVSGTHPGRIIINANRLAARRRALARSSTSAPGRRGRRAG